MEELPIIKEQGESVDIVNYAPIQLKLNEINYNLNIEDNEENIIFSINDKEQFPSVNYIRKMNLNEIKCLNKAFNSLNSFNNFYDYLKTLSNNNKLFLKKYDDKIALIISDKESIEIYLFKAKKDLELNIKEICKEFINMKEKMKEIDNIIKENKKLNEKIELQNKEIIYLKDKLKYVINKSEIMQEDEKKLIFSEIQKKMNKQIKHMEKLYQATIDGGDPLNFHLKCDNIPNTLILIKSEGQRRFGGFTPIPWKSEEKRIFIKDNDKKTFIFSLDNKKICSLKYAENAVYHNKKNGPCFGYGFDIGIEGNPIKENKLFTGQSSFDYKGESRVLSEFDGKRDLRALEYEVFQILFN